MAKRLPKKRARLPSKPSKLIRLALADLEQAEKDSKYEINMGTWHEPAISCSFGGSDTCHVCLAGAVMAFSLKTPISAFKRPEDFSIDNFLKLEAVNNFRTGRIQSGLEKMGCRVPKEIRMTADWGIWPYEDSASRFKNEMKEMADYLERKGL